MLSSSSLLLSRREGWISFLGLRGGKAPHTLLLFLKTKMGGRLQVCPGGLCYLCKSCRQFTRGGEMVMCFSRSVVLRVLGGFVEEVYGFFS